MDLVFSALADGTRRQMIEQLSTHGEQSLGVLAQPHDMSLPAMSKHLAILEKCGLVMSFKKGRVRYCVMRADKLEVAMTWLHTYRTFWEQQFDALDTFLQKQTDEKIPVDKKRGR
ncbi:MAG: helix-turn-helix transcriptional regulator [Planctomycetes bacterium]|nr:helix-turn-helix transcriptional regulator [Planctomycetota bacterium]